MPSTPTGCMPLASVTVVLPGDITGRGQYRSGATARYAAKDARTAIQRLQADCWVAHGLRPLSAPLTVDKAVGLDLHRLAGQPAAITLAAALAATLVPTWRMCGCACSAAVQTHSATAIASTAADRAQPAQPRVTVAQRLQAGHRYSGRRDAGYAATQLSNQLDAHRQQNIRPGTLRCCSCGSRGPHLYDGQDQDWRAVHRPFPAMPLLGIYGNGQFAPAGGRQRLLDGRLCWHPFMEPNMFNPSREEARRFRHLGPNTAPPAAHRSGKIALGDAGAPSITACWTARDSHVDRDYLPGKRPDQPVPAYEHAPGDPGAAVNRPAAWHSHTIRTAVPKSGAGTKHSTR